MPTQIRDELKKYFENGDKPNAAQFAELIDSMLNIESDDIHVNHVNQSTKYIGIGVESPSERLHVDGAIILGNTTANSSGTIRWTGDDFEGRVGTEWKSLTKDGEDMGIHMPIPRICVKGKNSLYAYWEDHPDRRFQNLKPEWHLYRLKSKIKQKYEDRTRRIRVKPKKWVHPEHQQNNNAHGSTFRKTEFAFTGNPGSLRRIDFSIYSYFKSINGILRPRGQGRFSYGLNKGHNNRRFEYFKLRTVLEYQGKKWYGPFSETFAVGQQPGQVNNSKKDLIIYIGEPAYFGQPR